MVGSRHGAPRVNDDAVGDIAPKPHRPAVPIAATGGAPQRIPWPIRRLRQSKRGLPRCWHQRHPGGRTDEDIARHARQTPLFGLGSGADPIDAREQRHDG